MRTLIARLTMAAAVVLSAGMAPSQEPRPRARDVAIAPGVFPPGKLNAITDVEGVRIGHVTLIRGDDVRTGVTAILPHAGNLFREKSPAGVFVGNAFGKLAGSTQIEELGTLETPIVLTNTLAVGTAVDAVVRWTLSQPGNEAVRSVNAVVGETNDGGLNDIRGLHVTTDDVLKALTAAKSGAVAEGNVGAGTGCEAFGWKGGIGTSSRALPKRYGGYTLGVLVQANYGGVLTMAGAPVGVELGRHAFLDKTAPQPDTKRPGDGSCLIVVATDAPVDARNLKRLAARAIYGLARTGAAYTNGSGDYSIAFSTHPALRESPANGPQTRLALPNDEMSPLFEAALEATEEAVHNALLQATTMSGRNGRTVEALPLEPLRALLRRHHVAAP
jgi:D-aminopeptidase